MTDKRCNQKRACALAGIAPRICHQAVVRHKPRLLSDNGSCYISGDLAEWLEGQKMKHVCGATFRAGHRQP